jgi:glycosyltransferase involved in cell wall biosynthesis
MPAYNCQQYIAQAIDSVLNQTYTNIELLIADDCSTDQTRSVINSYTDPRIKLYPNTENLGYLKTSNKLFNLCTGSYIAFQDADDYSDLNRIQTQYNYLVAHPNVDVVGCNLSFITHAGKDAYCSIYTANGSAIKNEILNLVFNFSPNTYLFKKNVLDTVGGYHEYFNRIGAEDYYWTVLILQKFSLVNIPVAMYYYRLNPESITGNLSDNPRKLYSTTIVQQLAQQCSSSGTDDLQQGNVAVVEAKMQELAGHFLKDKSAFLHKLSKRYFYEGKSAQALHTLQRAIKLKPYKISLYRDWLYFLRNK